MQIRLAQVFYAIIGVAIGLAGMMPEVNDLIPERSPSRFSFCFCTRSL